jgi:hypothetical protein
MSGRKMETRRGLIAIFLPAIFLLFEIGLALRKLCHRPS